MANHVTTRCSIYGSSEHISAFRQRHIRSPHDDEEVTLDFNTVIPMPEILNGTAGASDESFSLGLFALSGHEPILFPNPLTCHWVKEKGITTREEFKAWLEEEEPEAIEKAERGLRCKEETGFTDWFEWGIARWGTKWNSYGFAITRDEPSRFEFVFRTAWSFPAPVFERLALIWPELNFDLVAFDEGWSFAVQGKIRLGECEGGNVRPSNELFEAVYGVTAEAFYGVKIRDRS